ncbi:MAG: peptidyl-prolyl cis-trans isomerase [Verrucomicrobiota bacterium]|nr:peptidyl-prolyl cis-trans isomerase [Verrucomicrobiota bacterium]
MRKHHKTLMIIITVLVCISFSWYWNKSDFSEMGSGVIGKVYDRDVSQVEFQRNVRLLRLASQLGMRDLVTELTAGAQNENEAFENFSWNLLVLRHESDALGIEPTTSEIASEVKKLPAFQGEKGFDITRYTELTDQVLAPNGFSEAQIEELAADQIALDRVKKLLSAGISLPEGEMRDSYEKAYAKMDVTVLPIPMESLMQLQIPDEEIAKAYEARKAQLKSDEKRKVKFVQFALTDEQKKLTGKARVDVLQKLADQANDFNEALQAKGADFDQVVAKFKLTPKESGEFTQAEPDPELKAAPSLAPAAFALTNESPNSDAIQTPDGFNIMHLMKIQPSRPLTLDEARPKLVEDLKKQQAQQMAALKATDAAGKLREALKGGKSVAEAASAAGVQAEKLPPFALADPMPSASPGASPDPKKERPDMPYIKRAASNLEPGSVSDYINTPEGGLLVVLEKREKIDPAQYEKERTSLEARAMENRNQVVFAEWLRERRHAAGVAEPKAEPTAQTAPG